MSSDSQLTTTPKWMIWTGWIITILPVLALLMSGVMKVMNPPDLAKGFEHLGWNMSSATSLAIIEITFALIYLLPRTAGLGAILLTGYLGGAVATHARIGDPFFPAIFGPIALAVLVWFGLFLRDERLRALVPLRSPAGGSSLFVKILFVLGAVVIAFVLLVALQPGEFRVERSTTINAPAAEVFPQVNDFHKWNAWSPWVKLDPAAKESYEGPETGKGAIFRWDGNNDVGAGSMTITESKPNERIKINLDFLKPFEGTGDVVEFTFKEENKKTVVTWTMVGQSNLIAKTFHVLINMEKMIGDKYDEGLASLKSVVEGTKKSN